MSIANWSLGELLQIREDRGWANYRVTERVNHGLNLRADDGAACFKHEADLLRLWASYALRRERDPNQVLSAEARRFVGRDFGTMTDAERAHVMWLAPYLMAYRQRQARVRRASKSDLTQLIMDVAREKGHTKVPRWRTISEHIRKMAGARADGRWLAPRISARGNRTLRYGLFEPQLQAALRKYVLIPNKTPLTSVLAEVRDQLTAFNIMAAEEDKVREDISLRTIQRRVEDFSLDLKTSAWEGPEAARRKCHIVRQAPLSSRLLEHVEIDHTLGDIFLVDPETKEALARPVITAVIDRYSRMILGINIGFEEASYKTVMLCLRQAILPKHEVLQKYNLSPDAWPCFGVPQALIVDNGVDFHSASLDDATTQLSVDIRYCRARTPWHKGTIERWFGTLNSKLIHSLPGTTKSNSAKRGEYDSKAEACLTLEDFRKVVIKWIVSDYSVDNQQGIDDAPINFWRKGVTHFPPSLPSEVEDLDVLLLHTEPRVLGRQGIAMFGFHYSGHARLNELINDPHKPDKCVVKYNSDDLGWVHLLDWQTKRYLPLQCQDYSLASGLTECEHKLITERARRKAKNNTKLTSNALQKARVELLREIKEISARGKSRGRKIAKLPKADRGALVARDGIPVRAELEFPADVHPKAGGFNPEVTEVEIISERIG